MEKFYTQIKNTISKLDTKNIIVIGKGPSLDKYLSFNFDNFYVVNLNDSYKFHKGSLALINKPWALNEINKEKKEIIILSNQKYKGRLNKNINFHSYNFVQENIDKNVSYFIENSKNLYEPLFFSIIKIFYEIAKSKKTKFNIYFIGFDFNFKNIENYASSYLEDQISHTKKERKKILFNQKSIFIDILKNKKIKKFLEIKHIGNLKNSHQTINKFLIKNSSEFNFNHLNKVKIVAEITTNHFGNLKNLLKMVKLAKKCGADYIKIQKRDVESFYSKNELDKYYYSKFGNTFREYRNGLELSGDDLNALDKYCKKIGIEWFATILDKKSFDLINSFNPNLIKIPSTISDFKEFHSYVSKKYDKEIVISTGFTNSKYENYIIKKFDKNKKIYLLQCTSSYPTRDEDCNISVIRHYRDLSKQNKKIIPGYSSHDIGSISSMLAVASGALMIEKHVKLYSEPWAHFDKVALNLANNEFKNFVNDIRKAEIILGLEKKRIMKTEHHKYKKNL